MYGTNPYIEWTRWLVSLLVRWSAGFRTLHRSVLLKSTLTLTVAPRRRCLPKGHTKLTSISNLHPLSDLL